MPSSLRRFDAVFTAIGVRIIKTHVQAPRAAAIAERWWVAPAAGAWTGCLSPANGTLRLVLDEYADHYKTYRPPRTLHQNPPAGRQDPAAAVTNMPVFRRDRLGGLLREYAQVA